MNKISKSIKRFLNNRNNQFYILIFIVIVIPIFVLFCINKQNKNCDHIKIWIDHQTGCEYIISDNYIVPRFDVNGKQICKMGL